MDFKALPKIELHAHLTGSVTRRTLHDIWEAKHKSQQTTLEDPLVVMPEGKPDYNLKSFFPLFSSYIYELLTDVPSIQQATTSVLQGFLEDGVVYLELRTTPRATPSLTPEDYITTILDAIAAFEQTHHEMHTRLILSIDRRHDVSTAENILALAEKYRGRVVGLDLCGDPSARPDGQISVFTPIFQRASLPLTVHFGECVASGSPEELETLLSWHPGRLGHAICLDEESKKVIRERNLCLELLLSCNVQAGMTQGGFANHHFGEWLACDGVKVSLGTDDVGVFGSELSDEYRLAAEHFGLDQKQICALARQGIEAIFGGEDEKERLRQVMWI
ncbi:uncharacterized protein F5Z01DRAFT_219891 [Emericellopsis atlantica]|uniref:Adenosine deaminase domain-containing protein n=1 Tax=Emericellopsis atlantica TaxID=2614577 RepID=A0A9P7ZIW4_9HYPO|nr:uncharacterized protein F5Z01DRAFT_219891 [Emericellopsis atlantica]KAG9252607.1 hypothetical protein F5Z01DRAFT_219891 [Emericellopsis atlantica]